MNISRIFLALLVPLASSAEENWNLRWIRELPQREPAWKFTSRIPRDKAHIPVLLGGLVIVGCSHNDAVIAFDEETGEERWRFFTNGPIRFPPVTEAGRVYVASDDGHLYCLDLAGRLNWKVRGGPSERKVIGHDRLISVWPVSSRPLVSAGKVLFAAGHWPLEGIFIHALDASTGERIWLNDTAPIRPFGQMRVSGQTLFVDCRGRGGAFDIETGAARTDKPPRVEPGVSVPVPPGVEGTVEETVEAGESLLVSTREGTLYCYRKGMEESRLFRRTHENPGGDTSRAEQLIAASGIREGYALVLGLKDGALIEGLLGRSELHIIGIDVDADNVQAIHRRFDQRGLFDGYRLALHCGDPQAFGIPPYIASLILSETGQELSDAIFQHLRPYGGTVAEWTGTEWKLTRREGPLEGAADWTHEFAGAGNALSVPETLVKAPLGLLWYGGDAADLRYYFNGHVAHDTSGHGVSPLPPNAEVVDGRMILQGPGILAAVDIYTGRVLWETSIPEMYNYGGAGGGLGIHSKKHKEPWNDPEALKMEVPPTHHCRSSGFNYVTVADGIYVAAAKRLLRYDPANGKLLSDWKVPLRGDLCWGNIRISGDHLVATAFHPQDIADAQAGHDGNGGDWAKDRMRMAHVLVLHRQSGEMPWSRKAAWGFLNQGMAVGGGKVFCLDLLVEGVLEKLRDAGQAFPDVPPTLYALDIKTGDILWRFETDVLVKQLTYSKDRDILVAPCRNLMLWESGKWIDKSIDERRGKPSQNAPGRMRGLRGSDGTLLWEVSEAPYYEPHIIVNDLLIDRYGWTYDLLTGKRARRNSPLTGKPEIWSFRKGGCNHLIACDTLVTWRGGVYDLAGMSGVLPLTEMDAGCSPTFLPAGGILTAGNFGTHYKRSRTTALALIHLPRNEIWTSYASQRERGSTGGEGPILRAGFNLGAPGDRVRGGGTLWLAVAPRKLENATVEPKELEWFQHHSTRTDSWIGASGVKGAEKIIIPTEMYAGRRPPRPDGVKRRYTVRLHFAEPDPVEPGDRIFDVSLQGKPVLRDFDIVKAAGGRSKEAVREFKAIEVEGPITISLSPKKGETILCGIEILKQ